VLQALCLAVAAWLCASCDSAASPSLPNVPANLMPPSGQALLMSLEGVGTQIYECRASTGGSGRFEWVDAGARAELRDRDGKPVGYRHAGPTWELNDGSRISGEVAARDEGFRLDALPWLLFEAKAGNGKGALASVRSIQRLETVGGAAPLASCTEKRAQQFARMPYRARYFFYVQRG
jgi:hypothetical protein